MDKNLHRNHRGTARGIQARALLDGVEHDAPADHRIIAPAEGRSAKVIKPEQNAALSAAPENKERERS